MSERLSKNLILYFLITFIWTWGLWLPKIFLNFGFQVPEIFLYLSDFAIFGPLIAAVIVTYLKLGLNQLKLLLIKGMRTDFKKIWLLPTLFLSPLLSFITFLLIIPFEGLTILGKALPWQMFFPILILIFLLGGPLAEEYGWRGFALGRLQSEWNALTSSLILGIIWGLWHLPLHFIEGTTQEVIPIYQNIVIITLSSIIYTWLYNNTNKSVLIVMLFHLSSNMGGALFPYWTSELGRWIFFGLNVIIIIIILKIYGIKNLKLE